MVRYSESFLQSLTLDPDEIYACRTDPTLIIRDSDDGPYLYCMACSACATHGHLTSAKHQHRMTWRPEWYSCKRMPADALNETPARPASGNADLMVPPAPPPGLPTMQPSPPGLSTMQPSASAGTTSSSTTLSFNGLVDDHIALSEEMANMKIEMNMMKMQLEDMRTKMADMQALLKDKVF